MHYEVIGLGLLSGLFLGSGLGYCTGALIGSHVAVPSIFCFNVPVQDIE